MNSAEAYLVLDLALCDFKVDNGLVGLEDGGDFVDYAEIMFLDRVCRDRRERRWGSID